MAIEDTRSSRTAPTRPGSRTPYGASLPRRGSGAGATAVSSRSLQPGYTYMGMSPTGGVRTRDEYAIQDYLSAMAQAGSQPMSGGPAGGYGGSGVDPVAAALAIYDQYFGQMGTLEQQRLQEAIQNAYSQRERVVADFASRSQAANAAIGRAAGNQDARLAQLMEENRARVEANRTLAQERMAESQAAAPTAEAQGDIARQRALAQQLAQAQQGFREQAQVEQRATEGAQAQGAEQGVAAQVSQAELAADQARMTAEAAAQQAYSDAMMALTQQRMEAELQLRLGALGGGGGGGRGGGGYRRGGGGYGNDTQSLTEGQIDRMMLNYIDPGAMAPELLPEWLAQMSDPGLQAAGLTGQSQMAGAGDVRAALQRASRPLNNPFFGNIARGLRGVGSRLYDQASQRASENALGAIDYYNWTNVAPQRALELGPQAPPVYGPQRNRPSRASTYNPANRPRSARNTS